MDVDQENSSKFLSSSSSSESRESIHANADEEFYEEIEAPKFVDFTLPNHYHPDDRYWFCQRVGCNQNHEEEMDSEAIYKNFVLRVMAARSPNVRFRKALDRNASRSPIKCPLSAPPKYSKPRISRMAIISSISDKIVDNKKRVVRPLLKADSTPVTKTKPVAAKYLTTPRNKNCPPKKSPFRSVQNPKPMNIEVSKCQTIAKALVFRSPKKSIKVKTSVELRTPVKKLCEGMNKLEISSQKKSVSHSKKSSTNLNGNASRRLLCSCKVQSKPEEPASAQTCSKHEAKCPRSRISTTKGKLSKQRESKKLLGNDHIACSINNEGQEDNKQELVTEEITEHFKVLEFKRELPSTVSQSPNALILASSDNSKAEEKCSELEGSNHSRSLVASTEGDKASDRNELNGDIGFGHSEDQQNENNSSGREKTGHEFMNSDDKENAAASDENRMHNSNQKQNGRRILGGMHEKGGEVKKVVQTVDKHLKECHVSSGPVKKFKKPKPTNPKPFRLRTDERGILKEANLEKRLNQVATQSETANLSTLHRKLPKKQKNEVHLESIVGVKTPKEQKKLNVEASMLLENHHVSRNEQPKRMDFTGRSNSVQKSEHDEKKTTLIRNQSDQPQGLDSSKMEMAVPFFIPGQKLDVIHESSPEVSQLKKVGKPTKNDVVSTRDVAPRSSSRGRRRPVTVVMEPNFLSSHMPRSCSKKIK